jgi:hypothetical protein
MSADTPSPVPPDAPGADATAARDKAAGAMRQGDRIDKVLLADLLTQRDGPCVSVLMPTERAFPASQQNRVVLRNLLRDAAAAFEPSSAAHAEPLLAPLRALLDDDAFWAHPTDGLALYSAPGFWRALRTPVSMPSRLVVASTFHVKPLLRLLQNNERFQVLALNRSGLTLFEGDRHHLSEFDIPPQVPRTIEDALGAELTDPVNQPYSYNTGPAGGAGGQRHPGGEKAGGAFHGMGGKADETDKDVERFFRVVDRAVFEQVSKPAGLPLVLAALPEYQTRFRRISHNPHLVPQGVAVNPDALAPEALGREASQALQPMFDQRIEQLRDRFGASLGARRADDRLQEVAVAAAAGRVACLLVEAERHVPGRLDAATGAFEPAELDDPQADDLLDDIAERVLRLGGEVVILPPEHMPSRTGLAAIYRY